jgi:GMP synthase (glutamine-hydrolysing)
VTGAPHVLVVQHTPQSHPGVLGEVLSVRGCTTTVWHAWREPQSLGVADVDAVAVMGGVMNTDEEEDWPHLRAVRELLGEAVASDVPALGICLGAQLLAEATGGSVSHGQPEIGWVDVTATPSGRTDPVIGPTVGAAQWFSWHGDRIHLPRGATLLASSDDTPVQAFGIGSALGLQYHPEIDASFVAAFVASEGIDAVLEATGWTAKALVEEARRRNEVHRAGGRAVFGAWVDHLA